jgi:CRP-like cAMP-binding protein
MSSYIEVPTGQFVFREGDPGNEMFIIEAGEIEILRRVRGPAPLAILEPGDFFGEMAVLEDQPRFASARAKTGCRLLRVDRSAFATLIQDNFEIAVRIMRKLAVRLRRTEQSLQQVGTELTDLKKRLSAQTASLDKMQQESDVPPSKAAQEVLLKLTHASGAEFAVLANLRESLIGRTDPVTGTVPEINLGLLDEKRTLSRRHAKILVEGKLAFVREEVGTSNGTHLNDQKLRTGVPMQINPGDQLRFGAIELTVVSAS